MEHPTHLHLHYSIASFRLSHWNDESRYYVPSSDQDSSKTPILYLHLDQRPDISKPWSRPELETHACHVTLELCHQSGLSSHVSNQIIDLVQFVSRQHQHRFPSILSWNTEYWNEACHRTWVTSFLNSRQAEVQIETTGEPLTRERKRKSVPSSRMMMMMVPPEETERRPPVENTPGTIPHEPEALVSNEYIGYWGEKYAYDQLRQEFPVVKWLNETTEQGKPYDIEIHHENHRVDYIEVKSTRTSTKPMFEFTLNEFDAASKFGSQYFIYRVFNAGKPSRAHMLRIRNPVTMIRQKKLRLLLTIQNDENEEDVCGGSLVKRLKKS